jgi:hypothetical protein
MLDIRFALIFGTFLSGKKYVKIVILEAKEIKSELKGEKKI